MMAAATSLMASTTEDWTTSLRFRLQLEQQYHCIEADDNESDISSDEVHPAKRRRFSCSSSSDDEEIPFDLRQDNSAGVLSLSVRPLPRTVSLLNNNTTTSYSSSSIGHEYSAALKCKRDYSRSSVFGGPLLQQTKSNSTQQQQQQQRVYFLDTVAVKEIPSHRDCSSDVKDKIWTSLREIQVNAERNELEFIADGDDWEKCTEEQDFRLWTTSSTGTSELVHPFTYEKLQRERDEQRQEESRGQKRSRVMDDGGASPPLRRIAKVSSFQDLSKFGICRA